MFDVPRARPVSATFTPACQHAARASATRRLSFSLAWASSCLYCAYLASTLSCSLLRSRYSLTRFSSAFCFSLISAQPLPNRVSVHRLCGHALQLVLLFHHQCSTSS